MVALNTSNINKRFIYYDDNGGSNGARWAFFALFIVAIAILLLYTLKVNKRRLQHGSKPIAGTAWMTPPSYFQSQAQYNEPINSANVPPYSENALPNDAGYYDNQGNFIANPQYQPQKPPIISDETGATANGEYSRPSAPLPSHIRTPTGNFSNTNSNINYDYNRDSINNNSVQHDDNYDVELTDFTRPSGPPPAATRKN